MRSPMGTRRIWCRIETEVLVEAMVRADGRVGQVRIIRSLDRTFGLDDEALKAVKN